MKQIRQITKQEIDEAKEKTQVWDLGNQVLYDLCTSHPRHKTNDEIIAKVWLIGRSYAAAIERRKNKDADLLGDLFYEKEVAPVLKDSDIDIWFDSLKKEPTPEKAIEIHSELTRLFDEISGLEKRSLASKYLHFHFKDLFFIYDSRAMAAIRLVTTNPNTQPPNRADREYASFFYRCLSLKKDLRERHGCELSPHDLDKVLTYLADSEKRPQATPAHTESLPGKIVMASDFDAPLNDFKDYMK